MNDSTHLVGLNHLNERVARMAQLPVVPTEEYLKLYKTLASYHGLVYHLLSLRAAMGDADERDGLHADLEALSQILADYQ
jgi:hypothetical protein